MIPLPTGTKIWAGIKRLQWSGRRGTDGAERRSDVRPRLHLPGPLRQSGQTAVVHRRRAVPADQKRGMQAEQRLTERQHKTIPLLTSLESWLREKVKILSRHSELAKAFTYVLNQWSALTYYVEDGWAEVDNNIAENALRMVSLGRKNYLFFGSDH